MVIFFIETTKYSGRGRKVNVIKRDGKKVEFNGYKIENAINKAAIASKEKVNEKFAADVVNMIKNLNRDLQVEEIQDLVEKELMATYPEIAKNYILYRDMRNIERHKRTTIKKSFDGIVTVEKNNINNENANMAGDTPAGQMMTFASETTKDYTHKYLLNPEYSMAHKNGDIHIHDLDYYPTKTSTCVQYDLNKLFENGFKSKHGKIREPKSISTYATLATIVFQTNQNEQHGGQAIPAFDFFMAPGVLKSFRRHLRYRALTFLDADYVDEKNKELKDIINTLITTIEVSESAKSKLAEKLKIDIQTIEKIIKIAYNDTRNETHQAMEGFIHNLNTMHSRGGNQVVFSSINYGTDFSPEGRMVIEELFKATEEGLGDSETPVFPIQIFKVKTGISYSEKDFELATKNWSKAVARELKYEAPNFDLFIRACEVTSKRLFPNFVFLDTPFNFNEKWDINDPKRYLHEVATMGCRTRVFENVRGEKTSIGRGNISFTSINMPRLAIKSKLEAIEKLGENSSEIETLATELFHKNVKETAYFVANQLKDRFEFQGSALARQFPFMMENGIWNGGQDLNPHDEVRDTFASGTLGIGFIGGHNAMMALYGEGHGQSQKAYDTLYEAVKSIKEIALEQSQKHNLNFSALATPAEGLSGRFTKMDREKFGVIEGVNDREYYINSFHVDVKEKISSIEKIKREAPFHELTRGGHITYIELDGEAKKNILAIMKIVRAMQQEGIGYGSINHPVDRCKSCGFKGIIECTCPVCGSTEISRTRRITGYLTGDLDGWNSYKQAEEKDRVKHN
ncbi:MAG: anaerobic ribonucleoside triphosphate reductase [Fusobacteria bacterium]|nr:MAG: anaerobic ribonucleoside triphosphate reductase [Fusobacteriota bacterium]